MFKKTDTYNWRVGKFHIHYETVLAMCELDKKYLN